MKLIIDIPEERLNSIKRFGIKQNEVCMLERALISGTPLDDVKAEIADIYCGQYCENPLTADSVREMILDILDNIGKAESEEKECEKNT